MVLLSEPRYEALIDGFAVDAIGKLTCPVCEHYVKNITGFLYSDRWPHLMVNCRNSESLERSTVWLMAEDLTLLCSDSCLEVHNLIGGMYGLGNNTTTKPTE